MRIRWLLIGFNGLVLLIPIVVLGTLRIYDIYLMRQTERQLIAQSVVVAEAWRDAYNARVGESAPAEPEVRSPGQQGDKFAPIEPAIDLGVDIGPPEPEVHPMAAGREPVAEEAGLTIQPLLRRTQVFNLTALRVLDVNGCVVATTGGDDGRCLSALSEVQSALAGQYGSAARQRFSDEPPPPLGGVRRRGDVRVFTALPVFQDGRVIGVVRAGRTSLSALESMWLNRRGILAVVFFSVLLVVVIALVSSTAIAAPLRRIVWAAEVVAKSGNMAPFHQLGWQPEEFRVLTDALERMARQLEAKASYTAQYAANVSHELKTPITGIQGAAELLAEQWQQMSDEQRQRFLSNIQQDAKRISTLVTDLLRLARIENAPAQTEGEPIVLRDFFTQLSHLYGDRVSITVSDPPLSIRIDSEQLRSAICNLIDNALQHGSGRPRVGADREGERLRLTVSNDGPGIPPAHRQAVFERFFSTRCEDGGTGLGLAIVKAIAEARGGRVTLSSTDQRTTFTLVL